MASRGVLFRSSITGDKIWDMYISKIKERDTIFRDSSSSTHNCNHCNNFLRRYGNIVSINENNRIETMFDIECDEYSDVVKHISSELKKSNIVNIFFETFDELNSLPYESCKKTNKTFKLGLEVNRKIYTETEAKIYPNTVEVGRVYTFNHLFLDLPKQYVDMTGDSIAKIMSGYRDAKNVFKRALDEISLDTFLLVKDLILQGSLLDGRTHLEKIEAMIPLKKVYDKLASTEKDNWCWVKSYKFKYAGFKNELIGQLCTDLSEGVELNKACRDWNFRVDPVNYMKAKSPITEKQKKDAEKFVVENGYVESFDRRLAKLSDIKASEILHINVDTNVNTNVTIFDQVKTVSTRHKKSEFNNIEEVSIDKFMKDILPNCTSVEAYLTSNLEKNLVSLTTSKVKDSKPIFKWSNNYSWTFNGNIAGHSEIKENVKEKGGKVDGVLRFSIMWNETGKDNSDLDAWCVEPNNIKIGYDTPYRKDRGNMLTSSSGNLDVDIINPSGKLAVENIAHHTKSKLQAGKYRYYVNGFNPSNSQGFKAEIEIEGDVYQYNYNKPVGYKEIIDVATIIVGKNGDITIEHHLPETTMSKKIYGLDTNNFHKVNLVCLSPNHWDDNKVGNKFYFFMLDKCTPDTDIATFHAENLIPELAEHRKVLEVLSQVSRATSEKNTLSGLGFNATVKNELIVKLGGTFKRTIKLKF